MGHVHACLGVLHLGVQEEVGRGQVLAVDRVFEPLDVLFVDELGIGATSVDEGVEPAVVNGQLGSLLDHLEVLM